MQEAGSSRHDQRLIAWIGVRERAVTAAEATVEVGLSLDAVEARLLVLAVASGAQLQVSGAGEVSYRFPAHLRSLLLSRSWRLRLRMVLQRSWTVLFRLIRCAFGVVLLLLVIVVSLVVLVLGVAMLSRLDDDAGDVVGSLLWGSLELLVRLLVAVVSDQLWLGSPGQFSTPEGKTSPKRVAYLESVYSILFGDGDPNRQLEQQRWRRIGSVLQDRGGVVMAEDLAPLLDLPAPPPDLQLGSDWIDQAMLPVLLQFDGRPEVTAQGQLLYVFSSLQSPRQVEDPSPALPLRERSIPFSHASPQQRWSYGVLTFTLLLLSALLLHWSVSWSLGLGALASAGVAYALLLIVVPLGRWWWLRRCNRAIQARNRGRQCWAKWIQQHRAGLAGKRGAAAERRLQVDPAEAALIYTTETDLLAQEIDG